MKRKKRRMRLWLKFVLALVVLMLLSVALLFTPLFNITEITVSGASRYNSEDIKRLSGILPGDNAYMKIKFQPEAILGLRLIDSENAIKSLPYIRDADVWIEFPNKLVIEVSERQPAAYLNYLGNYLVVDSDGYVLEVANTPPRESFMEIRGIDFTKYAIGKQLETEDLAHVKTAVTIIEAIKRSDEFTEFKLWQVVDWIDIVDDDTALVSLDKRLFARFDPTSDKLQYYIDYTKVVFFTQTTTQGRGMLVFYNNQNPSFMPE